MSVLFRCVVCGYRHWESDSDCPRFKAEMEVARAYSEMLMTAHGNEMAREQGKVIEAQLP